MRYCAAFRCHAQVFWCDARAFKQEFQGSTSQDDKREDISEVARRVGESHWGGCEGSDPIEIFTACRASHTRQLKSACDCAEPECVHIQYVHIYNHICICFNYMMIYVHTFEAEEEAAGTG